ncbi:MAG: hypothetical protein JWP22_3196 [Ramlibacter sp.]|jgi:hypothetical protein|nr:hypothetical protein [Ramlibacter sp.]MDB5914521.1 hypothetical protein [Ramlibacter sp.]
MTVETAGASPGGEPRRARWRDWLQFAVLALLLLLLSEALWLWQTWPVRELLQPTVSSQTRPASR